MTKGQVVFSKCGRDKGRPFIVFSWDDEFVYLVDGDIRLLEKPKRKKLKHIQISKDIIYNVKEKLENDLYILDSDIRKALLPYKNI